MKSVLLINSRRPRASLFQRLMTASVAEQVHVEKMSKVLPKILRACSGHAAVCFAAAVALCRPAPQYNVAMVSSLVFVRKLHCAITLLMRGQRSTRHRLTHLMD